MLLHKRSDYSAPLIVPMNHSPQMGRPVTTPPRFALYRGRKAEHQQSRQKVQPPVLRNRMRRDLQLAKVHSQQMMRLL
jgi:hypothetical protein